MTEPMTPETIVDLFDEATNQRSRPDAVMVKKDGRYRAFSSAQIRDQVQSVSAGLIELGLERGERVALLSENRPEWLISDMAILYSGAINVPIYPTLPPTQVEELLNDSGAKIIILSTPQQLRKIQEIQHRIPSVQVVVVMDLEGGESDRLVSFDSLRVRGESARRQEPGKSQETRNRLRSGDVATIIYTSGTTGPPKGVMLSHANIVANVLDLSQILHFDEKDVVLSFLPLSHIFERTADYLMFYRGVSLAYAESVDTVPVNMLEVRPTVVACVPRFFEKLYDRIMEARQASSGLKRRLTDWAFATGRRHTQHLLSGTAPAAGLRWQRALAYKLVYTKLLQRLGGRLRFFISGGAPLDGSLAEFFFSVGVLVLEGYGLTETSPVIAVNRPSRFKFGTVGLPLPHVEVKIADDGEILTRGPAVMLGYYRKPEETRQAMLGGWFHTGDIGHLDQDGFLKITDRKKDLLVTAGGKKVPPQRLERLLKSSPVFLNAVVFGDRRPYISALVVPQPEVVTRFAQENELDFSSYPELLRSPQVRAFLLTEVEKLTNELASFERIKKVIALERDFSIEAGELTPTLKVRRRIIENKFRDEIEAVYAEKPPKTEAKGKPE